MTLFFVLFFLWPLCVGTAQDQSASDDCLRPGWVDKSPDLPRHLYGVGFSLNKGSPDQNRQEAEQRAWADLAAKATRLLEQNFESLINSINAGGRYDHLEILWRDLKSNVLPLVRAEAPIADRWRDCDSSGHWAMVNMEQGNLLAMARTALTQSSENHALLMARLEEMVRCLHKKSKTEVTGLAIGNIVYEDLGIPGPFSMLLEDCLGKIIQQGQLFAFKTPAHILPETRTSALPGTEKKTTKGDLIRMAGIETFLSGRYSRQGEQVRLVLSLYNTSKKTLLAECDCLLGAEILPRQLELMPKNAQAMKQNMDAMRLNSREAADDFTVRVWTNKGCGGNYKTGENMIIFFRASRDCYLKLLHISADNEINLIFPNRAEPQSRIKGNYTYQIGNKNYPIQFVVNPPYGAEIIKAVASLTPFRDVEGASFSQGFIGYGDAREVDLSAVTRYGLEGRPQNGPGLGRIVEDKCLYTVLEPNEMVDALIEAIGVRGLSGSPAKPEDPTPPATGGASIY